MALHKLVFDATDADTIAASANLGAYLRSSDGTLLTHTTVGAKEALDVRIAEGINVEVDLDAGDDSVASWTHDGTGNAISSTGGALHVSDGGGSFTVDAVDLDIRDLTATTDEVSIGDGTNSIALTAAGEILINDNGGSITVDAVDLDIRDLAHTSDSIRLGDGTSFFTSTTIGPDIGLDVNLINASVAVDDAALADTAIATAANALGVANTAEDLVAAPLANRKYLFAYNNGNKDAFIGATGVSAATGFPMPPGSILELRAGPSIDIEWVSADTNQEMRTLELS